MKTIGIIGGLSWFSTAVYYRTINKLVNEHFKGSHAARLILYSMDFYDFKVLQEKSDWEPVDKMLTEIAQKLETAGAECIVIASNTPHLVAGAVRQKIKIPLIHIAEETAKEIVSQNIKKIGLLGTKFTMEHSFFKDLLIQFGLEPIIPNDEDRKYLHNSIITELTSGIFKEETKNKYVEIIERLKRAGAEGVIFGCTEIALLVNESDSSLKVFDTTLIHSKAAVEFALKH